MLRISSLDELDEFKGGKERRNEKETMIIILVLFSTKVNNRSVSVCVFFFSMAVKVVVCMRFCICELCMFIPENEWLCCLFDA
jgi:hypothetical protein